MTAKGPVMRSDNFTSRVAGWSAAHRGAVVRGWLAFVLVAFALGSVAGMVQLKAVEARYPGRFIGEVGTASTSKAVNQLVGDDFRKAEATSVPITLFILVIAFGALVAAGVPLLLGLTAVLAALGVTELLSHVLHV